MAIWNNIFQTDNTNQVEVEAIFHKLLAINWLIDAKLFFNAFIRVSKFTFSISGNMYFKIVSLSQSHSIHHNLYAWSKISIFLLKKSASIYVCSIKIGIIAKKLTSKNNIKNKYIINIQTISGIFLLFILFRNGLNKTSKKDEKNNIFNISNCKYKKPITADIEIIIKNFILNLKYSFESFCTIFFIWFI